MTDYDDWVLRGPDDASEPEMEACETCKGTSRCEDMAGVYECPDCEDGEVEVILDEPDGDDEFERRRDAAWEDGR